MNNLIRKIHSKSSYSLLFIFHVLIYSYEFLDVIQNYKSIYYSLEATILYLSFPYVNQHETWNEGRNLGNFYDLQMKVEKKFQYFRENHREMNSHGIVKDRFEKMCLNVVKSNEKRVIKILWRRKSNECRGKFACGFIGILPRNTKSFVISF